MTQGQAIYRLKKLDYLLDDVYSTGLVEDEERNEYQDAIETVLSILEKQDKIIDLMSEQLTTPIHSKEWVKMYYENKVKERDTNENTKSNK